MVQIQERDAELRGIAIGEERGRQSAGLQIAKQLLLSNLSIDAIVKAWDLTAWQALTVKS